MKTTTQKAVEAIDPLSEAATLKEQISEGLADVAAGRVSEWNFEDFLREARTSKASA